MIKFRLYIILALSIIATTSLSFAQTATWLIKAKDGNVQVVVPGKIYVTSLNGQKGIVDIQTDKTLATGLDSVTPVVNGYALGLRLSPLKSNGLSLGNIIKKGSELIGKESEGATMMYSLVGIYDASTEQYRDINYGTETPLFVNKYTFFSEGLIPVTRDGNKYGYADTSGNLYLKINYKGAKPFSNGYAVVNDKEFIDRSGKKIKLCKEASKIKEAYSFDLNGHALVGGDNDWMTIDNRGNRVERVNPYVNGRIPENILGAWNPNGEADPVTTIDDSNTAINKDIETYQAGSLYGYKRKGKILVPAQFSVAQPFDNGFAYVESPSGENGLIMLNGTSPALSVKKSGSADANGMVTFDLTLSGPESAKNVNYSLTMIDSDKQLYTTDTTADSSGKLLFEIKAPKSAMPYKVESDGIIIWTPEMGNVTGTVSGQSASEQLKISISCKGQANDKGNVPVSVTISNPSSEFVSTTVKISGNNLSTTKDINLAPGESTTVYSQFTKVVFKEKRTINVTAGKAKASRTVELTPYIQL